VRWLCGAEGSGVGTEGWIRLRVDVVERAGVRVARALKIAAQDLGALAARLGPGREIMLVPGNHDAALVRPWAREHVHELRADTAVPPDATPILAAATRLLAPARITVHYPGVWLSDRVWATHGHYLDRHLLPASPYGVVGALLGQLPGGRATPAEYELARGPSVTRLETWLTGVLPPPLATLAENVAGLARAATVPRVPRSLLAPRMSPVTATLLGVQMQRAGIPALARVARNLGVDAEWVLFGHVHRLGPLPGDRPEQWGGPGGTPRMANTGSWVYEPLLLHRARPPHPYWPGGALLLEDAGDPQPVSLLDDLPAAALGGRR